MQRAQTNVIWVKSRRIGLTIWRLRQLYCGITKLAAAGWSFKLLSYVKIILQHWILPPGGLGFRKAILEGRKGGENKA